MLRVSYNSARMIVTVDLKMTLRKKNIALPRVSIEDLIKEDSRKEKESRTSVSLSLRMNVDWNGLNEVDM